MRKIDLKRLFGLIPAHVKTGKEGDLTVANCIHPMLENAYIKAAMIENDELAIQLVDLLTDGVVDKTSGETHVFIYQQFTAGGINVLYRQWNDENQPICISFMLGAKDAGVTLNCYGYGPNSKFKDNVWFEFSYRGKSCEKANRHFECERGEPLAEQIALPGFLATFSNLRLERATMFQPVINGEWIANWDLS